MKVLEEQFQVNMGVKSITDIQRLEEILQMVDHQKHLSMQIDKTYQDQHIKLYQELKDVKIKI